VSTAHIRTRVFVRLRYLGQSIELEVPLSSSFRKAFDDAHRRLLHGSAPDRPVEVASLRASAYSASPPPRRRAAKTVGRRKAVERSVVKTFLGGRMRDTKLYDRDALGLGARIEGPAVVAEYSSTIMVADGWRAVVDASANLVMERAGGR
jgi:N-methylhydantoinase A